MQQIKYCVQTNMDLRNVLIEKHSPDMKHVSPRKHYVLFARPINRDIALSIIDCNHLEGSVALLHVCMTQRSHTAVAVYTLV